MSTVGVANVIVRPIVADFRQQVAQAVGRELGTTTIPLPVHPTIPRGSTVTWELLASGAAVPKVVPLPVQPTLSPAAKAQFAGEIGGLRGALLGGGQFAASRALGISSLAAGVFAFAVGGTKAIKVAADLEQELNVFAQVSGATADQMSRVRDEARRLGADISLPAVSAGDAAATMTSLAKAGLSVDEVLQGTRGTLQLAAAANLDFATSAELASGALNAFQLPGTEAVKIADLLAGAANAAQGDIADFGQALTQSAAVAHQAGLSVQQTVTFLTELAKAGIQGSDAGTSLRVALLRLIAPTEEAKEIFRVLGIEINDAAGNVRVDVFEQLRKAMLDLNPATRNAALATIFGTDAIRSAAIFTREGAAGFAEMERQVSRAGQAQEAAAARASGFSGKLSALGSNAETLAGTLGTVLLPAAGFVVTELNNLVVGAQKAADALGDLKGFFSGLGDDIEHFGDKLGHSRVGQFFADVSTAALDAANAARLAEKDLLGLDAHVATGLPALSVRLKTPTGEDVGQRGALARTAGKAGKDVGETFVRNVESAITKEEQGVINAARRTVQNAQAALRDVVAEGARAVEAAAFDAKQNLTSIGQSLGAQVVELLDSGPLAQRIEALQDRLDRSREGLERGNLRRSLRDAREELARAEQQVADPRSAAERAGAERFLRPFREKVKDAQAALGEFNTQGNIDKLSERLERQKARIQATLDGIIAKFNAGLLSAPQVNAQVAALLQKNVGPMGKAGKAQGFAFRQAFAAQVAALQAQLAAIVGGPQTRRTGAEPTIVRPADVAKTAAGNVAAAQRSVKDAIASLHKTESDALKESEKQTDLLRDIKRQRDPAPSRPSSDVAGAKKKPRAGSRP